MEPADFLERVVAVLERCDVPYFVTGSVASIFYGEPRLTNDVDIVVELDVSRVHRMAAAWPTGFYFEPESALQALRPSGQFNVIDPAAGLKADLIVASDGAFDRARFAMARTVEIAPGASAWIAAPEHVILKKLQFYREGGSEEHLRDIAGILKISRDEIDRQEIDRWAPELGVEDLWRELSRRHP